jgi:hypothetical protein
METKIRRTDHALERASDLCGLRDRTLSGHYPTVAQPGRCSEREPADSLRDKSNVIGGWLPSLTFAFGQNPGQFPGFHDTMTMKTLMKSLALVIVVAVVSAKGADSYSVEATITLHKETKQYEAVGRVCKLVDRMTKQVEVVIARPSVISTMGSPGSFYVGSSRSDRNYRKLENVTMDVTWPKEGNQGFAVCTVIVKRGDRVLSKSQMQMIVAE